MSFTHRLFHLVWSCSQNGFLKLSYRTLEAKSWCSFSKYNDYALFQSNCSMCYMSKKKKHIEIFEKKKSVCVILNSKKNNKVFRSLNFLPYWTRKLSFHSWAVFFMNLLDVQNVFWLIQSYYNHCNHGNN